MEKWYIGFNTRGLVDETAQHTIAEVNAHQLTDFVVELCYEKTTVRKRSEFYFFIGVVSESKGVIPEAVYGRFDKMLRQLKLNNIQIYLYPEELADSPWIASHDLLEVHRFTRSRRKLNAYKAAAPAPIDPFDPPTHHQRMNMSQPIYDERYDQLLYLLSAYGRGSWQQFRLICETLGLDQTDGQHARRLLRRLRLLGHLEVSPDGQQWFIAPASLVALADHPARYFLAGQRLPMLLRALEEYASVECHPTTNSAPQTIYVAFNRPSNLQALIDNLNQRYHYPLYLAYPIEQMAETLPTIADWQQQLPKLAIVSGSYDYERWSETGFETINALPSETGLYRLTHLKRQRSPMTLFYDADQNTWQRGDWYGLRYLSLWRVGQVPTFEYDNNNRTLAIPDAYRPPEHYERIAVLASGTLPVKRSDYLFFANISETLAYTLALQLDAKLTP